MSFAMASVAGSMLSVAKRPRYGQEPHAPVGPLLSTDKGLANELFCDALVFECTTEDTVVLQGVYHKTDILPDGSPLFRQEFMLKT